MESPVTYYEQRMSYIRHTATHREEEFSSFDASAVLQDKPQCRFWFQEQDVLETNI
jgi:hypothetical protein